jgi:hypothetical protein
VRKTMGAANPQNPGGVQPGPPCRNAGPPAALVARDCCRLAVSGWAGLLIQAGRITPGPVSAVLRLDAADPNAQPPGAAQCLL